MAEVSIYGDPGKSGGTASTVGDPIIKHAMIKKALMSVENKRYFSQLVKFQNVPQHEGKIIKQDVYYPIISNNNAGTNTGLKADGSTNYAGNLWGDNDSFDTFTTGNINPLKPETGGRRNLLQVRRTTVSATMQGFNIGHEYSKESIMYDSDVQLESIKYDLMVAAAQEVVERNLCYDLLSSVGVKQWSGTATGFSSMTGKTDASVKSVITYDSFVKLANTLHKNKTPKQTTIIDGSTKIDTRTIQSSYIMYVHRDMIPSLEKLKDYHKCSCI